MHYYVNDFEHIVFAIFVQIYNLCSDMRERARERENENRLLMVSIKWVAEFLLQSICECVYEGVCVCLCVCS